MSGRAKQDSSFLDHQIAWEPVSVLARGLRGSLGSLTYSHSIYIVIMHELSPAPGKFPAHQQRTGQSLGVPAP